MDNVLAFLKKYRLILILGVITFAASFYIALKIDPEVKAYSAKLVKLHQNSGDIFIDLSEFASKVEDASKSEEFSAEEQDALKTYKEKLNKGIDQINTIYDIDIDNQEKDEQGNPKTNLLSTPQTTPTNILEEKSKAILLGIEKVIHIATELEKAMPQMVVEAYDKAPIQKLQKILDETSLDGVGAKKTLRLVLIIGLSLIFAGIFIFLERKLKDKKV